MEHFIETVETIDKGVGFSHFDLCHILWLVAFCVIALTASLFYRKLSGKGRKIMQWCFTAFIIADELWKWGWLIYMDLTLPKYLPLHLCSINIFLILFYTVKPTRTVGNFLYMACLPGALLALLTPHLDQASLFEFHASAQLHRPYRPGRVPHHAHRRRRYPSPLA